MYITDKTEITYDRIIDIISKGKLRKISLNGLVAPEFMEADTTGFVTKIRYKSKEWEKNQRGELHGGIVTTMFDIAMGMTSMAVTGKNVATAEITVSFIRPFTGNTYIFESEILHPGRNLVRVRGKAFSEETEKLLASATSDYVLLETYC